MRKKKSEWVDPDDAPELTAEWFDTAEISVGDKIVRQGRPPVAHPKKLVSLRLDQEVLAAFRALGPGWQTQLNAVLLAHVAKLK